VLLNVVRLHINDYSSKLFVAVMWGNGTLHTEPTPSAEPLQVSSNTVHPTPSAETVNQVLVGVCLRLAYIPLNFPSHLSTLFLSSEPRLCLSPRFVADFFKSRSVSLSLSLLQISRMQTERKRERALHVAM
jgi:hypothetical protein